MLQIPVPITRKFIREHPELTFVYGSAWGDRSEVGQAGVCGHLSNCFYVPTKWKLCRSDGWFNDNQFFDIKSLLDNSIANIPRDKPIILFPKIGCGMARMQEFAPKTLSYLMSELNKIKDPNYEYSYV